MPHLRSKIDGLKELKPLTRHSHGWESARTFSMESSKDYWRLFALPEIDMVIIRSDYRGALPKVLASFGSLGNTPEVPVGQSPRPNPKGNANRKHRKKAPSPTAGGSSTVVRLCPCGERLLKPGRNLAMAHATRTRKDAF